MLTNLSVRLASALLLHKGELSVDDIAALPTVEDEEDVAFIVASLLKHFDAEIQQRKVRSSEIPAWEEVVSLRPEHRLVVKH